MSIKLKSLDEFLNESKYQLYILNNELWIANGEGSGTTAQIKDINKFLTNKSNDAHYDSIVDTIVRNISKIKPLKKKGDKIMFDLPIYKTNSKLDIWGGQEKPIKQGALVLTKEQDYYIVNLFDNKNEANHWMN